MTNISPLLPSSKKVRLLIIAFIAALIILLVVFILINKLPSNQPVDDLQGSGTDNYFEGENMTPEYYRESLPDGGQVRYGTQHGPLSQEQLEELRIIVEEEKRKF